jgi:hypothetical protein
VVTQTQKQIIQLPYDPHPGQALFHRSKKRFRIMCTGRKWGKTTMLVNEAFRWLGRPNSIVWWVAPYYNLSQLGWRRFREAIPDVAIKNIYKKEQMIEMINGSTLWFKSGDSPDSLVGEGIDFLILDEAARIREVVWQETLRPNLSDPGRLGHACMASTPMGHNWFYREWLKGVTGNTEYDAWGVPIVEIPTTTEKVTDVRGGFPSWNNPHFRLTELQSALKLPHRVFLQEYAARFLEDLGAVFQGVTTAIRGQLEPPRTECEYYIGADLGKVDDYTVVTVVDSTGHIVSFDRWRKQSWTRQVDEIIRIAHEYNDANITIDATGLGDPVYDFMRMKYPNVAAIKLSANSKREVIENLALCIQTGAFSYPEIPELIEELALFGVEMTASGNVRYEAPEGFHDDCVISAALACWGLQKVGSTRVSMEWVDL